METSINRSRLLSFSRICYLHTWKKLMKDIGKHSKIGCNNYMHPNTNVKLWMIFGCEINTKKKKHRSWSLDYTISSYPSNDTNERPQVLWMKYLGCLRHAFISETYMSSLMMSHTNHHRHVTFCIASQSDGYECHYGLSFDEISHQSFTTNSTHHE